MYSYLNALAIVVLLTGAAAESRCDEPSANKSSAAVDSLEQTLKTSPDAWDELLKSSFASTPLTRDDAGRAETILRSHLADGIRESRTEEMQDGIVTLGNLSMRFFHRKFGKKPKTGWSLYISMHGGGGTTARVNDQQWENQKRLYQLEEGIYLVPRAPTNTWNLWHQGHIDGFFERLITNFVVFEGVDPDRVFLMGYSAGGDGVYQLAPRMADQLAAAAMMAGHPNETSPLGLRNLAFTIHVGEKDAAYNRNAVARSWKTQLAALHQKDAKGYPHLVKLHAGKGHWMDRQDAEALKWMSKYRRTRYPQRIVWKQDDVSHDRFYWLAVKSADAKPRALVIAERTGQQIQLETADASRVTVLLNDDVVKLDEEISITSGQTELFRGRVPRTIQSLVRTVRDRGGLANAYSAAVEVTLPAPK